MAPKHFVPRRGRLWRDGLDRGCKIKAPGSVGDAMVRPPAWASSRSERTSGGRSECSCAHHRFALVNTLPLVLGVNIAIFTIFNAAVSRPLAVDEPDRVVRLYEDSRDAARRKMFSFAENIDYRDRNTVFSDVAAYGIRQRGGNTCLG
jgi:hypothetical protein